MVKYKGILILLYVYLGLVVITVYSYSLFLIYDIFVFIIFITQVGAAFISIVVFLLYLKAQKTFKIFLNISNHLDENSNWDLIQNLFQSALRLKPSKDENPSKISFFLVTLGSLFILSSIIINFMLSIGIIYYIIPGFFALFLVIINLISKVSQNPTKKLIKWIYDSNMSLNEEFNRLKQFKIEGTSDYFEKINLDISNLSIQLQNFEIIASKIIYNNSIFFNLSSLKKNSKIIYSLIQNIYEIRGKLMTLMSLILELRKNQVLKYIQLEQIKKKEIEVERLKIIDQKEAKFQTLEIQIEESFSKKSKEFTANVGDHFDNLGKIWNEKISEFEQKISQVYEANYQRFGTLNEELKDNYQKLQSKATSLFFEKFYQGLIQSLHKEISIEKYFEEFMFVAEIFFSEAIAKLDRAQLPPIMEKLCLIHESLK